MLSLHSTWYFSPSQYWTQTCEHIRKQTLFGYCKRSRTDFFHVYQPKYSRSTFSNCAKVSQTQRRMSEQLFFGRHKIDGKLDVRVDVWMGNVCLKCESLPHISAQSFVTSVVSSIALKHPWLDSWPQRISRFINDNLNYATCYTTITYNSINYGSRYARCELEQFLLTEK